MVLDLLVPGRRDKRAAKRLLRKLLKRQCRASRVMITDKLPSSGAAKREVMPDVEHRQHKGLNNRAENSHQPTRRRERQMKRFKSPRQTQRFLSAHYQINNLFHLRRDHISASEHRAARAHAFEIWANISGLLRQLELHASIVPGVYQLGPPRGDNLTMPGHCPRPEDRPAARGRRGGWCHQRWNGGER
jgi:hypothetical protein